MNSAQVIEKIEERLAVIKTHPNLWFRVLNAVELSKLVGQLCTVLTAEFIHALAP